MLSLGKQLQKSKVVVKQSQVKSIRLPKRNYIVSISRPTPNPSYEWQDNEVTLYIKGFLSPGESADRFQNWRESHLKLTKTHQWSGRALGYYWDSGSLPLLPVATVANLAFTFIQKGKIALALTPQTIALLGIQEAAIFAGRITYEYLQATKMASVKAPELSETILSLRKNYKKVRVVAHSLGCRFVVEALKLVPQDQKPDEIHLCAPAITEVEALGDHLHNLTSKSNSAFLYHCERDYVLGTLFTPLYMNTPALGSVGPKQKKYEGLKVVDVNNQFDTLVHFMYKRNFHKFAEKPEL